MNNLRSLNYRYNGARALVLLHEQQLKSCLKTWRQAKKMGIILPSTDDADYLSLETLLKHIFRAARGYMTWICEKLQLPDPEIAPQPVPDRVEADADAFVVHLLDKSSGTRITV